MHCMLQYTASKYAQVMQLYTQQARILAIRNFDDLEFSINE